MRKTIRVDQRAVSYREQPGSDEGLTVLMVHGATDHGWIWHHQIEAIDKRHRRIAVDLPGRIGSDGPAIDNAKDFRNFIATLADALDLTPFVFFGHSMGGSMALDFALHHPQELLGFAMIGSSPSWEMDKAYQSLLREDPVVGMQKVNSEFGDVFSPHASQAVRDELMRENEAVPARTGASDLLACMTYHLENDLEKIDLPALVICGDDDPGSLPGSRLCAEKLPGASFELVEHCGHCIMIEQPEVLNTALNHFLDTLN